MIKQKAFTLIELLVVIVIIGILATISTATFNEHSGRARDSQRVLDITNVNKAIQAYFTFNGSYPSTGGFGNVFGDPTCNMKRPSDQNTENWVPDLVPTYIDKLPQDPLGIDQTLNGQNNSDGTCYMYASNGTTYILSAWGTVESDTLGSSLFRRIGFREGEWNSGNSAQKDARVLCNHRNIGGLGSFGVGYEYDYYQNSYTISNDTTCSDDEADANSSLSWP